MRNARKASLALAISVIAVVGMSTGPALADEAHGQGRSPCHFSGLNDDPDAEAPEGGRVQSYGQLVRQGLKDQYPSPGVACNPNNDFFG